MGGGAGKRETSFYGFSFYCTAKKRREKCERIKARRKEEGWIKIDGGRQVCPWLCISVKQWGRKEYTCPSAIKHTHIFHSQIYSCTHSNTLDDIQYIAARKMLVSTQPGFLLWDLKAGGRPRAQFKPLRSEPHAVGQLGNGME